MCQHCAGGEPPHRTETHEPHGGSRWRRRLIAFIRCVAPVTALALVPKCPACLAGYVLVCTGIGLSMQAASALRWVMIAACVAVPVVLLLGLAVKLGRGRTSRV